MKLHALVATVAAALAAVPLLVAAPAPAGADHSWGTYHWARTSNPFTLKVGDNVHSGWDAYLDEAIKDWHASTVLDLTKVRGGTTPRQCKATGGQIEVCAERYGFNGWLGLAQIWISGGHITQGTAKMNDSYFNTATYNTPPWRRLVMCQEIAHDFGLGHQDENFDNPNLGSCMDYARTPAGPPSNEHPNAHDFDQLVAIYTTAHGSPPTDSTTTVGQTAAGTGPGRSDTADDEGPNDPRDFGRPTGHKDGYGRDNLFERNLPDGRTLFTHVFWALPGSPSAPGRQ